MRFVFLLLAFCFSFSAFAQDIVDPTKPVVKTEGQLVAETICKDLQKDETYESKDMVAYKKIVAGDDGWVFRTSTDFRTEFKLHPKTITYMKRLQDSLAAQGITFLYLIPPTRGIAEGEHVTGDDLESVVFRNALESALTGYHAMNKVLLGARINAVEFPDIHASGEYFYKRDHHWNPQGAKLAATRVAEFLKAKPIYETLQKTPFVTKSTGIYDYSGSITDVVQPICKLYLMGEKTEKYVTELAVTAGDKSALFDEKKFPEVVFIGASNSAGDPSVANFEGFLKEALQTDVYNASIVGAGIDAPILAYLNSKAFHEHKPKVIIWETPGYYDHNVMHSRVYRQAIPAVLGDCTGKSVAEAKGVEIKSENVTLLSGLQGRKIKGSQYYVVMKFSAPVKKPVHLSLNYAGSADTYKITRSLRYPFDGEFNMLFKDTKSGWLDNIKVVLEDKNLVGHKVDVRVCRVPASIVSAKAAVGK